MRICILVTNIKHTYTLNTSMILSCSSMDAKDDAMITVHSSAGDRETRNPGGLLKIYKIE